MTCTWSNLETACRSIKYHFSGEDGENKLRDLKDIKIYLVNIHIKINAIWTLTFMMSQGSFIFLINRKKFCK